MFVPFSCGATLVRDGGHVLRDAFDMTPEDLNEDRGGTDVEFDFFRYGQMGTRRFNSLKLWMAMESWAAKATQKQWNARLLSPNTWQSRSIVSRTSSASGKWKPRCAVFVLCRKEIWILDRLQQRLQQIIERSGEAWLTTTVVRGRRVMRVNINSFLTEQHHIDDLIKLLVRSSEYTKSTKMNLRDIKISTLDPLCAFRGQCPQTGPKSLPKITSQAEFNTISVTYDANTPYALPHADVRHRSQ